MPKIAGQSPAKFHENPARQDAQDESAWVEHTVKPGETLSGIAAQNNIPLKKLIEQNKSRIANPNVVRAGQVILIPNGSAVSTDRYEPPKKFALKASGKGISQTGNWRPDGFFKTPQGKQLGISAGRQKILQAIARCEAGFDGCNTKSKLDCSWGICQWNALSGDFQEFMADYERADPDGFKKLFADCGYTMTSFTMDKKPYTDVFYENWIAACRDLKFQEAQILAACRRLDKTLDTVVDGVRVGDCLKSDIGQALIFSAQVKASNGFKKQFSNALKGIPADAPDRELQVTIKLAQMLPKKRVLEDILPVFSDDPHAAIIRKQVDPKNG